jgi:hypothetical protein
MATWEVAPLERVMERFVIQQNIEHYRAMVKIATDLERRGVFEKLLREEEAKLKKYEEDHKKADEDSSRIKEDRGPV